MPIRPIDIQTLLMQLSQVGRDQAVEKEGAVMQAATQGAAALKRQAQSKEAVKAAERAEEGAEPVGDRGGRGKGEGAEERREGGDEGEAEAPKEEIVRDPELGTKVDLSG